VPAGLVYIVAALALIAGWMRLSDRTETGSGQRRREVESADAL
jgi:hypothetical protein